MRTIIKEVHTREEFERIKNVTDEYIFRRMAARVVEDMPFEDLQRMISLKKIDPESEQSNLALMSPIVPSWVKKQIIELRQDKLIKYEAEVII